MQEMQPFPFIPHLAILSIALSSPLAALESGEDRLESFGLNGETDNYTIVAEQGASLIVSMGVIEGNLQPSIIIFDPNEDILAQGDNTVRDGLIVRATAPVAGRYRIKTTSLNRNFGDYRITAVAAPGPLAVSDENQVLTSGQTVEGSIPIGDLDVFTIEASAGASIRVGIGSTDGTFDSRVELIDPTGATIANSSVVNTGLQIDADATVAGTYTIVVSERSEFKSGDYRLSAFVSGEPIIASAENGNLSSGQRISGDLPLGDFDAFTFSANEGDAVRMAAGDITSRLEAEIEIFGPNGFIPNTQGNTTQNTTFTAPASGTYTALISNPFGTRVSDYQVTLVTLPTNEIVNDDGINRFLTSGNTIIQAMGRNDLQFYSFAGTAGDAVTIDFLRDPDGSRLYTPRVEIFAPNGERLENTTPGSFLFNLAMTGDYYLVVFEPNNDDSGVYSLTVTGQTGTPSLNFVSSPPVGVLDLTAVALPSGTIEISYPTSVTGLSLYRSQNSLSNFLPLTTLVENGRNIFRVTNPTGKEFFRLQETP